MHVLTIHRSMHTGDGITLGCYSESEPKISLSGTISSEVRIDKQTSPACSPSEITPIHVNPVSSHRLLLSSTRAPSLSSLLTIPTTKSRYQEIISDNQRRRRTRTNSVRERSIHVLWMIGERGSVNSSPTLHCMHAIIMIDPSIRFSILNTRTRLD